jgi:hypothetical protein
MKSMLAALIALSAAFSAHAAEPQSESLIAKVIVNSTFDLRTDGEGTSGSTSLNEQEKAEYYDLADFKDRAYGVALNVDALRVAGFSAGFGYYATLVQGNRIYLSVDRKTGAISVDYVSLKAKLMYDSVVKNETCNGMDFQECMEKAPEPLDFERGYRKSCLIEIAKKDVRVINGRVSFEFAGCGGIYSIRYEARVDQIWKAADLNGLPGLLPRK